MRTIIFIAFVAWVIACFVTRRNARRLKNEKLRHNIYFGTQYPEMQRAIDEAVGVISNTKDIETGIKSFASVRSYLKKMASISPERLRINLFLNGREAGREIEIGSTEADDSLRSLEKDWIRATSLENIGALMKQSEAISDPLMNVELMREALRAALKGLEYLPEDETLKIQADLAERRLNWLSNGAKN